MSTAQKVRPPKQQQAVWTETKSLNAVKSIIRTSISQICYLRALFPENCFSVTPFAEDVSVHALTPAKEVEGSDDLVYIDDDAWALTRWLEEGVFVALEKQYLKKMAFCIYTDPGADKDKPKALVESCELHSRTNQAINQQLRAATSLDPLCACTCCSQQTAVVVVVLYNFFTDAGAAVRASAVFPLFDTTQTATRSSTPRRARCGGRLSVCLTFA